MGQIAGRNLISVGTTAVLARLLLPSDYGLIGMVATLVALLQVFSDMGLSWATIQRRDLTAAQVSNLFWINAAAGLLLWVGCIVAAPGIAQFYGRPELRAITMVMGASFFIGGLAVQPFALMRRRMDFRRVALVQMASVAGAAISALAAAAAGWGYWALVIQALAGQAINLVGAWPGSGLRLHWPRHHVGTRGMVAFGGLLALNGILIYVARNFDSVFIGRAFGATELGYYNRAYFLMMLPSYLAMGVLTDLMVPSLVSLQDLPQKFGDAYRRAVRLSAFVGCPMALGLALTAGEAVQLVYGPQWLAVVPMLLWLSIAGITQPIYNTTGWLFTAKGRAGIYLVLTGVNAVALLAAFWLGSRISATAVAAAYGLVMGLLLVGPALMLAHHAAHLRTMDTLRALLPTAACLAIMAAAVGGAWLCSAWFEWAWWQAFALKVGVGVAAYVLAARWLARVILVDDLLPMLPRGLGMKLRTWV